MAMWGCWGVVICCMLCCMWPRPSSDLFILGRSALTSDDGVRLAEFQLNMMFMRPVCMSNNLQCKRAYVMLHTVMLCHFV